MQATLLKGCLGALLVVGGGVARGAGSVVRTFCNPMVVENVPLSNFASILPPGERVPHRCLADPTLLREGGKWYLFSSCGQIWRSDDDGGTWRKVEGSGLTKPGHAPTAVKHGGRSRPFGFKEPLPPECAAPPPCWRFLHAEDVETVRAALDAAEGCAVGKTVVPGRARVLTRRILGGRVREWLAAENAENAEGGMGVEVEG